MERPKAIKRAIDHLSCAFDDLADAIVAEVGDEDWENSTLDEFRMRVHNIMDELKPEQNKFILPEVYEIGMTWDMQCSECDHIWAVDKPIKSGVIIECPDCGCSLRRE